MNDKDIELNLHKLVKRKTIGKVVLTKDAKMFKKLLKENANLNRANDRLDDELENLKEAYGGEIAKLKQELEKTKKERNNLYKRYCNESFNYNLKSNENFRLKQDFTAALADKDIFEDALDKSCSHIIKIMGIVTSKCSRLCPKKHCDYNVKDCQKEIKNIFIKEARRIK